MNHYQRARQEAIDSYYANPKRCKTCGKVIPVIGKQKVKEVRRKKFCNKSCASKYNNTKFPKRSPFPGGLEKRSKKEVISYYNGDLNLAKPTICYHARETFKKGSGERACRICGYSKFYDVAHIKPVAEFSADSLLEEINNLENLVPLCPNHHREFDAGQLDEEDKRKIWRVAGEAEQARLEADAR